MRRKPVRPETWMLWAAPAMLAAAFTLPGWGKGAALFAWMAGGALLSPRRAYPYVRKRRPRADRLFFACGLCWLLTSVLQGLALRAMPEPRTPTAVRLAQTGAVLFGLSPAALLREMRIPRRFAWPCGAALCAAAALL